MNHQLQLLTVKTLNDTYDQLVRGEVSSADILSRGRLSIEKLGLKCTTNSALSDPKCHQSIRKLKLFCECIVLGTQEVASIHGELIRSLEHVRATAGIETRTELSKRHKDLYARVCAIPESSTIFRLAGLDKGRSEYLYHSDEELVLAATAFASFTELKNKGGELHRHIKGRALEKQLLRARPGFATGFYVGLNEAWYRSIPELTLGNLLAANEIDHVYEMPFSPACWSGSKPLKPDFYFPAQNAILEVAQTVDPSRGSRREMYVNRMKQKESVYSQVPGLQYRFVDCDPYFHHQGFDVAGWIHAVVQALEEMGVSPGPIPQNISALRFENDETKDFYLNAPQEVLLDLLLRQHQISGVGHFFNKYSPIKNLIRSRSDNKEILCKIREFALARKSNLRRIHAQRLRDCYVPIKSVQRFLHQYNIHSQAEWNFFAKMNKTLLKQQQIPANLRLVYMTLNQWTSWTDVLKKKW